MQSFEFGALTHQLLIAHIDLELHLFALHLQLEFQFFHLKLVFTEFLRTLILLAEVALLQAVKVLAQLLKLGIFALDRSLLHSQSLL